MPSIGTIRAAACALVGLAACPAPGSAHGQTATAQASGSTEIVGGAVSAGVSFDVATRLLTSIFVTGGAGDTVSIFVPAVTGAPVGQNAGREATGLSSGQLPSLGDITIVSSSAVSIDVQQIRNSPGQSSENPDAGVFVVLAQFN